MDPSVLRIEPLISARFSHIPPINVPKYSKFLLDDDQAICLGNEREHKKDGPEKGLIKKSFFSLT